MASALVEKRDALKEKAKFLHDVFAQAGDEMDMSKVTLLEGDAKGKTERIKALNDELADLGREIEGLVELDGIKQSVQPDGGDRGGFPFPAAGESAPVESQVKSLSQRIIESKALSEMKGRGVSIDVDDVKTLFARAAGWAPEVTRTGRVVDFATTPIDVLDVIPVGRTSQSAVKYMEETTFTNSAAEAAEGGSYGESALALTERTVVVQKIATWLPVTDEQLEDVSYAEGYLDRRLGFMVRQRLNGQVLVGNGTDPNLRGINNVVGIQTQAKGANPTPDAFYMAMVKIMTTGAANPNAIIMNPLDWQDIALLRTNDGIYIWGSPSEAGPQRLWGLPVALSQAQTQNTGLVGDTSFCELAVRRDVEIQVTNSHADYFVNGKQAVRADMRAAFVVYRPGAFCTVTGI